MKKKMKKAKKAARSASAAKRGPKKVAAKRAKKVAPKKAKRPAARKVAKKAARKTAVKKNVARKTAARKPVAPKKLAALKTVTPAKPVVRRRAPVKEQSGTAIAAEALRTGVLLKQQVRRPAQIPHEDELIKAGDPDDDSLANEYSGEDTPGGSTPTPDQNEVDEIGRAYGLQDEDNGELRSGEDVLGKRDRHRDELRPPKRG